jgi:hypothetical protein
VPEDRDVTEQALDALVYGPVGLAMYLRDTAPSFLKLFVARGRAVLDEQRKSVEGQLGQAKAVGQFATTYGGPQVQRLVEGGLSRARERAEDLLGTLGTFTGTGNDVPVPPADGAGTPPPTPTDTSPPVAAAGSPSGLAITDYDALSASQVVDRLEGLSRPELEAIREYEVAHRARNTVLGKIEQLTRPVG